MLTGISSKLKLSQPEYKGQGIYTVTDLNTGVVLQLDSTNRGDAQMITAAYGVRYAGVVSRNAMGTRDGAIAGDISTPIVHPQVIDLGDLDATLKRKMAEQEQGHEQIS